MRRYSFVAVALLMMAFFAASAYSQGTGAAPSGKIGLVDTGAFFDDKPGAGIPKLKTAVNSVNAEFKKVNDDLTALGNSAAAHVQELLEAS